MVTKPLLESIKPVREKHFSCCFQLHGLGQAFFKGINFFILPNQLQHEDNLSANYKNKSEDL